MQASHSLIQAWDLTIYRVTCIKGTSANILDQSHLEIIVLGWAKDSCLIMDLVLVKALQVSISRRADTKLNHIPAPSKILLLEE